MLEIQNATAGNVLKNEDGTTRTIAGQPIMNDIYQMELIGQPGGVYVLGADPARTSDNFAIVVIKIVGGNYRVVYADAWRRKEWGYSVRRMREIIKTFNIQRIAIDHGGGGMTIRDFLRDEKYIEDGELPIFELDNEDDQAFVGMHILEVIDFSNYKWYRDANYDLQGDIHHRRLMFPPNIVDEAVYKKYGGLLTHGNEVDDAFEQIQECKRELSQIERTANSAGREHFDLPKEQIEAQKTGVVQRKDRYSALLLAAHAAREFTGTGSYEPAVTYAIDGAGWLSDL